MLLTLYIYCKHLSAMKKALRLRWLGVASATSSNKRSSVGCMGLYHSGAVTELDNVQTLTIHTICHAYQLYAKSALFWYDCSQARIIV